VGCIAGAGVVVIKDISEAGAYVEVPAEKIMGLLLRILFCISGFIIVWAMVGYPLLLRLIGRLNKDRQLKKDYSPTVTVWT